MRLVICLTHLPQSKKELPIGCKPGKNAKVRIALACVLVTVLACRGGAYREAKQVDTIAAWRQFVAANPTDPDVEVAANRLEQLEFDEAKMAHSIVGYKRHLERYPQGSTAPQARARLEGLRFNAAQAQETLAGWQQFVREHPDGNAAVHARGRIDALVAREASAKSPAALAAVVAAHADDAQGVQAKAQLESLAFAQATSSTSRLAYLREFPAGQNRDSVKAALLRSSLEGLLVSGALAEADSMAAKSPLLDKVPDWPALRAEAARFETLRSTRDTLARAAYFRASLPARADIERLVLSAEDPMLRWEAADTLADHVSVLTIDVLLKAVTESRLTLVRLRAFAALRRLVRSLPSSVAEHELASRLEAAPGGLTQAVLHDLLGRLDKAGVAYEQIDRWASDPLVLARAVEVKAERGQRYAAAVAARQLTVWVSEQLQPESVAVATPNRLWAARELCGVAFLARRAHQSLVEVAPGSEFPADVEAFTLKAEQVVAHAQAKLRDAELAVLAQDRKTRLCADDTFTRGTQEAESQRLRAVRSERASPELTLARAFAAKYDPSLRVRAAAAESQR
jgi:hypothetical protein